MLMPDGPEQSFVSYLEELADREDRGALATLRRVVGRSPAEVPAANRYVDRFVDQHRLANPKISALRVEAAYYMIASLFASHPVSAPPAGRRNFGASLAQLKREGGEPGIDRRFAVLLDSHEDELGDHLAHLVGYLKSAEGAPIGVDWTQLLRDVLRWGHPDRLVQRGWARAFWTKPEEQTVGAIQPSPGLSGQEAPEEEQPSDDEGGTEENADE